MRTLNFSADLDIPADVFFLERDSLAFRTLVAQVMHLGTVDLEKTWEEGGMLYTRQVTHPSWDAYVPGPLQNLARKYIGDKLVFVDILGYNPADAEKAPYIIHVKSIPPVAKETSDVACRLVIEDIGGGRCRQTLEGKLSIGVPLGLGGLVERVVAQQLEKVYRSIPDVVSRWAAFRQAVLAQPGGHEVLVAGRPAPHVAWMQERMAHYAQGGPDAEPTTAAQACADGAAARNALGPVAAGASSSTGPVSRGDVPATGFSASQKRLLADVREQECKSMAANAAAPVAPATNVPGTASGVSAALADAEPGVNGAAADRQCTEGGTADTAAPRAEGRGNSDQGDAGARLQSPAVVAGPSTGLWSLHPACADGPAGADKIAPGSLDMGGPPLQHPGPPVPALGSTWGEWAAFWEELGRVPAAARGNRRARKHARGLLGYVASCGCAHPQRHLTAERRGWDRQEP